MGVATAVALSNKAYSFTPNVLHPTSSISFYEGVGCRYYSSDDDYHFQYGGELADTDVHAHRDMTQ